MTTSDEGLNQDNLFMQHYDQCITFVSSECIVMSVAVRVRGRSSRCDVIMSTS